MIGDAMSGAGGSTPSRLVFRSLIRQAFGRQSTSVVRDEDRFPQQMLLECPNNHRSAGTGRYVQFLDVQRINRKRIAMRRISLIGAGTVICVVAKIGAALFSPGWQD